MQPHICPSDISLEELRKKLGEHPNVIQIEDYLFDNLNDDFSGMGHEYRQKMIAWYFDKCNKF